MEKEASATVLATMIFLSMVFGSLPLVSAAYTVNYPYMPPEIKGDFNCDGKVDGIDLALFIAAYHGEYHPLYDLNNDGTVNGLDFAIFIQCYKAGEIEGSPIAYSTSFEFTVPSDGDNEVWYYVLARVYVPASLSGQSFSFIATADERVQNVKLNNVSKPGSGSSVNINLGSLGSGYHLLEFEYVEIVGGGSLNFCVATASQEYAWLARFRIYVPIYRYSICRYNVTTCTWTTMQDDYFLIGNVDDFIENVCVDGLVWQDWEWQLGPDDVIYGWDDGFCYPLGNLINNSGQNALQIKFTFGDKVWLYTWNGGLLDFQYISWDRQRDRIGLPKFYALANAVPKTTYRPDERIDGTIENATLYGGSKWSGTTAISDRFFESRLRIRSGFNSTMNSYWGEGEFEIGLGIGWAKPDLPLALNDMGITLNLTSINFTANFGGLFNPWWETWLKDVSIDIYSFPELDLMGMEFTGPENIESIVNPDWTTALDYTGTVIMFISTTILPATPAVIGSLVGVGMKGIAAIIKFSQGQQVPDYVEQISGYHHRLIKANSNLYTANPGSQSSAVFIKLSPNERRACGLTKIVLRGTLTAMRWEYPWPLPPVGEPYPMTDIEISICIPWFIW